MINQQNQQFKSTGLLALLGLVAFCLAIIATPWNRQMRDSGHENARQKAEVVGYQVVQMYREASKNPASSAAPRSRGPASAAGSEASPELSMQNLRAIGTMGIDPWGRPFNYRIISADPGGRVRILVWSTGPNLKVESHQLENEQVAISSQPLYGGDDIGVLLTMSQ